jgi:CRISPR-associated protein Csb2
MIAISLRFLVGRFHATPWGRHVNEGAVEYPPSPWRLLRSLVATFYRTRPAEVSEDQLKRILLALASAAPAFHLPSANAAHTRHYDRDNGGLKFFDAFLAMNLVKDGAASEAIVWLWSDVELSAEDRRALDILLRAMNTFGRAESWCEAELLPMWEQETNCEPLAAEVDLNKLRGNEPVRVLTPQAVTWSGDELLEALKIETSTMRKKDKQLEPAGTMWVTYARPLALLNNARPTPRLLPKRESPVTLARFALDSKVLPRAQDTLPFCELVRRILISKRSKISDSDHSELIVGKTSDGTRLKGHRHAHIFATDEDNDGKLDHLTVALPFHAAGFSAHDVAAITSLRRIRWGTNEDEFRLNAILIGTGETTQFIKQGNDPSKKQESESGKSNFLHSARCWRSTTPFVLPRFATRGGGKKARPRDEPIAQLKREAASRGLPEIVAYKTLERREFKTQRRAPISWREFKTRRLNGTTGYGTAGFEIEFAEEITCVPLALGFGCHFGLGLFEPVLDLS